MEVTGVTVKHSGGGGSMASRWTKSDQAEGQAVEMLDDRYALFVSRLMEGSASGTLQIPKILHFIWLGNSKVPWFGSRFIKTWTNFHPGWALELWDDDRAASFWNTTHCRTKGCFEIADNLGKKSDILRYEILYHYGGVYVDIDYECLGSLTQLGESCSFFAGRANVPEFPSIEINNGLIGCCRYHPLLSATIEEVAKNVVVKPHQRLSALAAAPIGPSNDPTGGLMAFLGNADQFNLQEVIKSSSTSDTISSTGPGMFTGVVCAFLVQITGDKSSMNRGEVDMQEEEYRDSVVIFPSEIFCPLPNTARVRLGPGVDYSAVTAPYLTERSLAVHHWQSTWE